MKLLRPLRRALVGLAALATLVASAAAQAVPKVQIALLADASGSNSFSFGQIHRLDVRTGKYLGAFGSGSMFGISCIAIQPVTSVVYVADNAGVKRYDMSTGRFLGLVATNTGFQRGILAMRFNPAGALYVAYEDNTYASYQVAQLDPNSGAVLATSSPVGTNFHTRLKIGFRPNGNVEVFDSFGGLTFADQYPANLSAYLRESSGQGEDKVDLRMANDSFIRVESDGFVGGDIGDLKDVFGSSYVASQPLIADGATNQTYIFDVSSNFFVQTFDTSGVPFLTGVTGLTSFSHGALVDAAIYLK